MIMTPDEIRPTLGERYRHRRTGRVARVRRYRRDAGQSERYGCVILTAGVSWEWAGSVGDFWEEWILANAFDEALN